MGFRKVRDECGNIVVVLAQTKVDLLDQAQMSTEEVETLSKNLGLKLFRTCTKQNLNIFELFNELGMEYLRRGGEAGLGVSAVGTMEYHAKFSDGTTAHGGNGNTGPSGSGFSGGGGAGGDISLSDGRKD